MTGPRNRPHTEAELAGYLKNKNSPLLSCLRCKGEVKLSGFSRHEAKCVKFQCKIAECARTMRYGAIGYCGFHYAITKNLRDRHKISLEDYLELVSKQNNRCAICGRVCKDRGDGLGNKEKTEVLHLDHCHESGKIRQLLCFGCNTGLGHFKDDPERLRNAANYIERHTNGH